MSRLKEFSDKIIEELLKLSPEQRVEIFTDIQYNEIFCVHCGYGSIQDPNPNCQCNNDE